MSKYFVRVLTENNDAFLEHVSRNNMSSPMELSTDLSDGKASTLYAMHMTEEEALALKLSFPLKGCMNFQRTIGRQVPARNANIATTE